VKTYTVEEAAKILQVTPYTIRAWLKAGKLPGRKVGGVWRILDSALEDFLTGGNPDGQGNSGEERQAGQDGN